MGQSQAFSYEAAHARTNEPRAVRLAGAPEPSVLKARMGYDISHDSNQIGALAFPPCSSIGVIKAENLEMFLAQQQIEQIELEELLCLTLNGSQVAQGRGSFPPHRTGALRAFRRWQIARISMAINKKRGAQYEMCAPPSYA